MLKVLTFSSLFPNALQPNWGIFVETQTRKLAQYLSATETGEVRVINPRAKRPWPFKPLANASVALHEARHGLNIHRPHFLAIPKVGTYINDHAIVRAARPILKSLIDTEFRPDVIDAEFFWPCGVAAATLGREFNIPVSIKARGSDINHWSQNNTVKQKLLWAAASARGLLAVSDTLRSEMIRIGMAAEKIRVHYTGIDLSIFKCIDRRESRVALGLASDVPTLVCVGNLVPLKGHRLLLSALQRLPDVHLLVVGQGPERESLQELAAALHMEHRVRFIGPVPHDQLPAWFAAADASILCSENEGLANVWIESLACGTPVISSNVGGAAEVITNQCGALIDTRDAGDVAAAIQSVLAKPYDRETLRQSASRFTWENNTEGLVRHLLDCVHTE